MPALSTLIERFITARIADGRAERTLRDYERVLRPFALAVPAPVELTRDQVRAYVAGLQAKGWAPATVGLHVRNLRAFLHWLHLEGYTPDNLARAIKAPRQTMRIEIPITPGEVQALLATCLADNGHDRRDRAMILALYDTGLRTGELVRLVVGNWRREPDGSGSYLLVFAPKTQSFRYAILGQIATAALAGYLARRETLSEAAPLFAMENGQSLRPRAVGSLLVRRAARAGLARARCHPHIFRKAFATAFLDNGGDAERLRVLAGWSSLEMVRVYADSSLRKLQEAHRRAGPVDRMRLGG